MKRRTRTSTRLAAVAFATLAVALAGAGGAKNPPASDPVDFSSQIRPIISGKCFSCHGADEGSRKAKLRLDLRDEAIKDRKGIRAIVPGDLANSEMVRRITAADPDDVMPPPKTGHKLTESEIELLKRWIQQDAPYTPHWAFVKPERPPLPKVGMKSWPKNALDRFVLAKLEKNGLKPSPPADRYTLIRRLSLDLTGLPPTPQEVEAFVNDHQRDATERLIDHLLGSPAYGERWARVWLDLARYADSAGYGSDPLRLDIWPWRDWVIKALNRNLPYDRFTIEQIAGDLLPGATEEDQTATGFHRNTMTNTEGGTDDEEYRVAAVKDRANVTAQVWMGLTMGCAQCHSHKYDPITHREYYQFFALFNQTEDNDQPDEKPTLPLPSQAQREKMDELKAQMASLEKERGLTTAEFETELADWEEAQAKGVDWIALEPFDLKSSGGTTLSPLPDHSILASGTAPDADTYTVKARANATNLTAVRLELLPDPSLPQQGPGRAAETGKAVLTEFRLALRSPKTEPPRARYVRVELPGAQRILSLAEVQVFNGSENVASRAKASQSSTDGGAEASRAVDGNTDGDFASASTTLTRAQDSPWWELDLGAETPLEELALWNRTDLGLGTRLADFKVLALDAQRKTVWEKSVGSPPNPVAFLRVSAEKEIKLQNASADFGEKDYEAAKAIDGNTDAKNGWSIGDKTGQAHAASFEVEGNPFEESGALMIFTLVQKYGTNHMLGHFRISATTQSLPVRELPERIKEILAVKPEERSDEQRAALADHFRDLAPSLAKVNQRLKKLRKDLDDIKPVALPVMRELAADKRRETHILNKGNFLDPGEKVEPGVPAAFHPFPSGAPADRLGLAQWLVSRDNPLTARVAVNRLWAQLFGIGIVETEEDFGTQGSLPSHRELLDWLAVEFMDDGWDMKAILKTMVMSAAYQQSSRVTPVLLERDPRNRLLARGPRRRLDAETVRDEALALSGMLSRKLGGPSVYPWQPDGLWQAAFNDQRNWQTSQGEDRYRRGLYVFWRRSVPYPSMATFDAPSRETCTVRRIHTNTPLQAFVTLNDPVYVEASQALGRRLMKEGGQSVADRVRFGLRLCLARPPSAVQVNTLVDLYEKELAHYRGQEAEAKKLATEPLGPLPENMGVAEAAAWTSVANVLLNLDGVLTKG
jgi:mono/diheme cytochrome c family protein